MSITTPKTSLYFFKYNNYYNRIHKKLDSLSDYLNEENAIFLGKTDKNNFYPNDWINAAAVINWTKKELPDYMLVVEDNLITSHWFVIFTKSINWTQIDIQLRRDLITDYYDQIISAPSFIEKATPFSQYDPAICNSENMTFNQTKYQNLLLKDETLTPWVVGYIPKNAFEQDTQITVNTNISNINYVESVNGISNWKYYKYAGQTLNGNSEDISNGINLITTVRFSWTTGIINVTPYVCSYAIYTDKDGNYIKSYKYYDSNESFSDTNLRNKVGNTEMFTGYCGKLKQTVNSNFFGDTAPTQEVFKKIVSNYKNINLSSVFSYLDNSTSITEAELTDMKKYNGKYIKDLNTGTIYKVIVTTQANDTYTNINQNNNNSIYTGVYDNIVTDSSNPLYHLNNRKDYSLDIYNHILSPTIYSKYGYTTIQIIPQYTSTTLTIPSASNRLHNSSPYDIFAIPLNSIKVNYTENGTSKNFNTSPDVAITIGQEIAAQSGVGQQAIYDVQLLPYCPARGNIPNTGTNVVNIGGALNQIIKTGTTNVSVILWASEDYARFPIKYGYLEDGTRYLMQIDITNMSIEDAKVHSETRLLRFCSPNFSSSFDFNYIMNQGIQGVYVEAQFKPYSPYIKVRPHWNGLYGINDSDGKGLFLGGDYSLAQITSAWADYELQNKNYQKVFDRQITNLEINNSIQYELDKWSAISGTVSGTVQGAMGGAMAGSAFGPVGMGIGAVVGGIGGGVASGIAGMKDVELNQQLRNETLDYTKDMYGYQLGNIQALPYGLTRTTAISIDNKLYPFIEFYKCSEEEESALRNKLKYNGYTIMRIGKIADYIIPNNKSYIKAKVIRMEDVNADFHIINEIAKEFNMGVFI